MAGFSDYLEAKLLDHVLQGGTADYTPPSAVYVGLHSGDPDDDGFGLEASGMSYERKLVTFTAASSGGVTNTAAITWTNMPEFTVAWIVIWDAQTDGNPLFHGGMLESRYLSIGSTFSINPGDLDISLD